MSSKFERILMTKTRLDHDRNYISAKKRLHPDYIDL